MKKEIDFRTWHGKHTVCTFLFSMKTWQIQYSDLLVRYRELGGEEAQDAMARGPLVEVRFVKPHQDSPMPLVRRASIREHRQYWLHKHLWLSHSKCCKKERIWSHVMLLDANQSDSSLPVCTSTSMNSQSMSTSIHSPFSHLKSHARQFFDPWSQSNTLYWSLSANAFPIDMWINSCLLGTLAQAWRLQMRAEYMPGHMNTHELQTLLPFMFNLSQISLSLNLFSASGKKNGESYSANIDGTIEPLVFEMKVSVIFLVGSSALQSIYSEPEGH